MAGHGKSTAAEVAARVDTVMTKLLRGTKRAEIIRYASETWKVDERQTQNYITRATKLIAEITQPRKEYEFALVRQRLEELYDSAFKDKNYNAALGALKQVAEMTGINEPTKIDVEVTDLTDAQSRLARLVAGHATRRRADGVASESD